MKKNKFDLLDNLPDKVDEKETENYEILKPFHQGSKEILPGDKLPKLTETALAALLRKGVLAKK